MFSIDSLSKLPNFVKEFKGNFFIDYFLTFCRINIVQLYASFIWIPYRHQKGKL